jgi:2-aminoadipate transaminase
MHLDINRASQTPIYLQIAEQLRRQILDGSLPPGCRLPSERKLSERLSVNRTTVLNAFAELKAEGLLGSRPGSGTVVLAGLNGEERTVTATPREPVWNQLFSRYAARFSSSLVKELLQNANRRDFISFATGIASPESGPIGALEGIEHELITNKNYRPLLHSPTEGLLTLRRELCGLMRKRGVFCSPEEVMLLSGSQQGIDLAARLLLDPGDIVVIEEPTYFPAIQVFKTAGARIISVPVQEDGMQLDMLEQLLHRYRPKLIYTNPSYHNPTGTEMSLEKRRRLVELAERYNVLVLEDDAYGDLTYEGPPQPLMKSMDRGGYVIYLGTFSKIIYSGLRLGWITADKRVIREFSSVKQLSDLHSSSLSQWIVERFIASGDFERHLKKICAEYKERRDIMAGALKKLAPRGMTWNNPAGGYYIWCRLPEGISAEKLVSKAAEHRVSFIPGAPFFASGQGDDFIRLNFTYAPVGSITEGVKRLCHALRELMEEYGRTEPELETEISPII